MSASESNEVPPKPFIYSDGTEPRISVTYHSKIVNLMTITIHHDNSLGAPLHQQLSRDSRVLQSSVEYPQPLYSLMKIKVQTKPGTKPMQVLREAIQCCIKENKHLLEAFNQMIQSASARAAVSHVDSVTTTVKPVLLTNSTSKSGPE